MPLAKLVCPKCRATLKPAKPVPEGKTVKCPKCEETFTAGGKAAPKKSSAVKPAPDEEQEEAATYAVLKDEDEEKKKAAAEERKRRKKRKRDDDEDDEPEDYDEDDEEEDDVTSHYLETLKTRDPRGAAQETIVGPANWLLRTALIGFFGWVFYFGAFMLPVAFPNIETKEDEQAKQVAGAKEKKDEAHEKKQATHWWSADEILADDDNRPWRVVLFVFVLILGMVQAGAIANGSVKMNSLESYNWSLWGCILAIVPLVTFPLFVFITYLLDLADWLLEMGMDETCWLIALVAFVWGPLVGGVCLKKFLEPQVKPGFEYKPE